MAFDINKLTKPLYLQLKEILRFTRAGQTEAKLMESWLQATTDPQCYVCPTCGDTIRHAHQRIKMIYNTFKWEIEDKFKPKSTGRPKKQ
jgi:hypothetical protein